MAPVSVGAVIVGVLLLLFAKKVLKTIGTLVILAGLVGLYLVWSGAAALPLA